MTGQFEPSMIAKLEEIRTAFRQGLLGKTSHEEHPGLPRDSRENYLYFMLAPALNYQRRSEQLWRAAARTHDDPVTSFVFEPSLVCEASEENLRTALTTHSLATRPARHTDTWKTLCNTLTSRYGSDPRAFLQECAWDIPKILDTLRIDRKSFPVIAGPKMSNYWLFILSRFTDAKFTNMHEVSIIPDIHVRRASVQLGVVADADLYSTEKLANVWRAGLQGSGILPSELHGPLWLWSRAGFPEV